MADLPLTLTVPDYARLLPLAAGLVKPMGIDLTLQLGHAGSWADRAEMLRRALHDPAVHGGEGSMGMHLMRLDAGDRSHVAIPVFPLRNFTARDLYVRIGSAITIPGDLAGKRIGMYSWSASGSIWYRHFLRWAGLDISAIHWTIGGVDTPGTQRFEASFPSNVVMAQGKSLGQMLIDGEVDAVYSPGHPHGYDPKHGPIVRMIRDFVPLEKRYYTETGCFPPQHLIVLRRAVWEAYPWIGKSLTDAFIAGNDLFTAAQRSFPYGSPFLEAGLEETEALMGTDFHPYGIERNRHDIDTFCAEAHRLGLVSRTIGTDEYFAEFLAAS